MVNSQAYTSQRSFAAAAGVSAPALKKTLGLADCPVNAKPPWTDQDLEILKAYRQHLQEYRAAERNGEKKAAANSQGAPVAAAMSAARMMFSGGTAGQRPPAIAAVAPTPCRLPT